ncbi:MAG: tetraacyldisaccharide 4'-kinase [Fibrobacteria bacterium]|nr:tetraacyldisaccharide 4'-kinase [Fibrobacteria bacterium]
MLKKSYIVKNHFKHYLKTITKNQSIIQIVCSPILFPFCAVYHLGGGLHRYFSGMYHQWEQNKSTNPNRLPVIVVGSLKSGGSGKTSLTVELTNKLLESGIRVAVIAYWISGYNRDKLYQKAGSSWQKTSDEAMLLKKHTGANVYVTRKRNKTIHFLSKTGEYDCIVSDDGFQDQSMRDAFHMVLLEGTKQSPFKPNLWDLLPLGRYRQTASALKYADIILSGPHLMTPSEEVSPAHNEVFPFQRTLEFPKDFDFSREWICFCALGNPENFVQNLVESGVRIKKVYTGRDHKKIPVKTLRLARVKYPGCGLLTTEKDCIKYSSEESLDFTVIKQKIHIPETLFLQIILQFKKKYGLYLESLPKGSNFEKFMLNEQLQKL